MSQLIQQTVILGGGFTGLYTALDLRRNNYPHSVILVDKEPCFRFRPLLYEYFSEQMDELQVMPRFEDLLRGSGVRFVQDTVDTIDLDDRQVKLQSGTTCPYSNLVIALGSVTDYFGVEGAQDHAIAFRDGGDAIALDQRIRSCIDLALQSDVPEHRQQALTFVVIGGGPTGVELSATLADLLPNWYQERGGDPQEVRVVLLPNSAHNLQAGLKWFNEGVLKRYLEPAEPEAMAKWIAGAVVTAVVARKVVHALGSGDDS